MGQDDGNKQPQQEPAGGTEVRPQDATPARPPRRGPRTLTRNELETLRARLQKKFH
jgi:hypothetical protein